MFNFLKSSFQKIKDSLKKTSSFLGKRLKGVFSRPIDQESLEEIESILYEADVGSKTVEEFIAHITLYHKEHKKAKAQEYLTELQQLSEEILLAPPSIGGNIPLIGTPQVILIVGVNGTGKTTTIAKLAKLYKDQGKKVLLAAADTFRAAASSQLETWAKRLDMEIVTSQSGADPSSVLYDAMAKGKAKGFDIILCDSAGRLESKTDLLQELKKMDRTAKKQDELAPHEVYLIVDATLGQTVLEQMRIFNKYVPITGIILTKIDGSAKGGVALAMYRETKIPIHFVGFGEKIDDLAPFDPKSYTEALFSD
jgi:fused signal recognition particle receptor